MVTSQSRFMVLQKSAFSIPPGAGLGGFGRAGRGDGGRGRRIEGTAVVVPWVTGGAAAALAGETEPGSTAGDTGASGGSSWGCSVGAAAAARAGDGSDPRARNASAATPTPRH